MSRLKTPITYYGGKQTMLPDLLPRIPEHTLYCEPFLGGGALFWAKDPSRIEVINDMNGELINFYRVVQTRKAQLDMLIAGTLHSQAEYEDACTIYRFPHLFDEVRRAWAIWVGFSQSYSSSIGNGFAFDKTEQRTAKKVDFARTRFASAPYAERLERVTIECGDALAVIKRHDSKDSFFYLDPPYPGTDQGHYCGYSFEDFERLLKRLESLKGKFLLSNFPSDMLEEYSLRNGWHTVRLEKSMGLVKHTRKKIEVLTANYPI